VKEEQIYRQRVNTSSRCSLWMSVESRTDPLIWFKGFEYIYFVRQLRVGIGMA
jgi:hypothetical protein